MPTVEIGWGQCLFLLRFGRKKLSTRCFNLWRMTNAFFRGGSRHHPDEVPCLFWILDLALLWVPHPHTRRRRDPPKSPGDKLTPWGPSTYQIKGPTSVSEVALLPAILVPELHCGPTIPHIRSGASACMTSTLLVVLYASFIPGNRLLDLHSVPTITMYLIICISIFFFFFEMALFLGMFIAHTHLMINPG